MVWLKVAERNRNPVAIAPGSDPEKRNPVAIALGSDTGLDLNRNSFSQVGVKCYDGI